MILLSHLIISKLTLNPTVSVLSILVSIFKTRLIKWASKRKSIRQWILDRLIRLEKCRRCARALCVHMRYALCSGETLLSTQYNYIQLLCISNSGSQLKYGIFVNYDKGYRFGNAGLIFCICAKFEWWNVLNCYHKIAYLCKPLMCCLLMKVRKRTAV